MCVAAVLLLPLLLLASPGRADSRGATRPDHGARPHAARAVHALGMVRAESVQTSSPSAWGSPMAVAADLREPVTTTTVAPTTTTTRPVVRAAAVTTTTVARATTTTAPPTTTTTVPAHSETGQASWYSAPTGTCASPNLAFGTTVTVTNLATGASTTCTVDDRMDPSTGRVLDMSEGSFSQIADPSQGVIQVRLTW